jgi:hypothetical protein
MTAFFWEIDKDDVRTLTPALRTYLTNNYAWTNVPAHTHAALVNVRRADGCECVLTFVHSIDVTAWTNQTGALENAINDAVKARLLTLRNAAPLTSIVGVRHFV